MTTTRLGGAIVASSTHAIPPECVRITIESPPAEARQSPNIATAPAPVRAAMARTVARSLHNQRVKQNNTIVIDRCAEYTSRCDIKKIKCIKKT